LIDSLDLALKAREIDMRASPYDLTAYKGTKDYPFGLGPRFTSDPICVETAEVNEPLPLPSLSLPKSTLIGKKALPAASRRGLPSINSHSIAAD
jgi:hypothetical protein